MKNNLLLFIVLFALACENKHQTEDKEQVNLTAASSIEQKSSVGSIEDELPVSLNNGAQTLQIGQVGGVRKGMLGRELYSIFDSTQVQKQTNKRNQNIYSIYENSDNPLIICTTENDDVIHEIIIQGDTYKTQKGIGVGSTFADLTKAYHIAKVMADKNHQVYVQVEELQQKQAGKGKDELIGIQFEIGFDASGLIEENGSISATSIPPDARIVRIFL